MKSGQTSGNISSSDLNEIPKEEFGSKVVKFSLKGENGKKTKDLTNLRSNCRKTGNQTKRFRKKSEEKKSLGTNTLRSSKNDLNGTHQSLQVSGRDLSSSNYSSNQPKRKAVINLKSLLQSQSEKENRPFKPPQKAEGPSVAGKSNLILASELEKEPAAELQVHQESFASEEMIFNEDFPKSTRRTTNNYQTQNFEAPADAVSENDTL